jgi:hypothetical protein
VFGKKDTRQFPKLRQQEHIRAKAYSNKSTPETEADSRLTSTINSSTPCSHGSSTDTYL